jgi:hypothetical protein
MMEKITNDERLEVYLEPIRLHRKGNSIIGAPPQGSEPKGHFTTTIKNLHNEACDRPHAVAYRHYLEKIIQRARIHGNKDIRVAYHDGFVLYHEPTLAAYHSGTYRQRGTIIHKKGTLAYERAKGAVDVEKLGVCLKFLYDRWWKSCYEIIKRKPPRFRDKIGKCVWRGVTTGDPLRAGNRFDLVEKWKGKSDLIDVGFNKIAESYKRPAHIKANLVAPVVEWANHKYIISSPGNMNESGLSWKLASNSVIIMPKPCIYTWLLESRLVAGRHFIQVKGDWSDLEEKIQWCEENQDKCEEIANNAREFVMQFSDIKNENLLEDKVLHEYMK